MDSIDERQFLSALERIVRALEENTRINQESHRVFVEWIATQTAWREEAEALTQSRYEETKAEDQARYEQARIRDQSRLKLEQRLVAIQECAVAFQSGKLEQEQASFNELSGFLGRGQQ